MSQDKTVEVNSETNTGTESVTNDMIPKARLDEVIGQRNAKDETINALNKKLETYELSQKEAREEKLKQNEQQDVIITELKAELETTKLKANEWDNFQADRRKTLTEKLPENLRYVADEMKKLSSLEKFVEDQTAAINSNRTDSTRAGVQPGGDFGGYSSWEEFAVKDPTKCAAALANQK